MTVRLYLEGIDKGWEIQMPYRPREGDMIYPTDQEGVDVQVIGDGWYLGRANVVEVFVAFTSKYDAEKGYFIESMEHERRFRESVDFDRVGIQDLPSLDDALNQ